MRNVALFDCELLSFLITDAVTKIDIVGLHISDSVVNSLALVDAGQDCTLSGVELDNSFQTAPSEHFLHITSELGGVFDLSDWYVHDTAIGSEQMVTVVASNEETMVVVFDWRIERVDGADTILFACSKFPVFASRWTVANSTLLSVISALESEVRVTNSSFGDLEVSEMLYGGESSLVVIHNVTVSNVSASKAVIQGGTITQTDESMALVIGDSSFSYCSPAAVIVVHIGDFEATNCQFTNNHHDFMVGADRMLFASLVNVTVTKDADTVSVPSVIHSNLVLSHCTFRDARASILELAKNDGLAFTAVILDCLFDGFSIDSQVELFQARNCTFLGGEVPNDSGSSIGSLSIAGSLQTAVIDGCNFLPRSALSFSSLHTPVGLHGAVTVSPVFTANVWIENSFFFKRLAFEGAAIFSTNADLTLLSSEIRSGTSTRPHKARCSGWLTRCSNCSSSAGALYMQNGNLTMADCHFSGNFADQVGGDVVVTGATTVLMTNSTFEYSTSLSSGGSLYVSDTVVGTAIDLYFFKCHAVTGGAIAMTGQSEVSVVNATVRACVADSSGGAVSFHQNADSSFIGCVFVNNNASSFGGAVLLADFSTPALSDCVFAENFSFTNGGGIAVQDHAYLVLEGSILVSNYASGLAGGLLLTVHCHAMVADTRFEGNTAMSEAGGVGLFDFAEAFFLNVTFEENSSPSGGALQLSQYGSSTFVGCTVERNEAMGVGAGLAVIDNAQAHVFDCLFVSNGLEARTSVGGAICTRDSASIALSRTIFVENSAWRGGAVFLESNLSAAFTNCSFVDNVALFDGGAIGSSGLLRVRVEGCHFRNNSAANGSGGAVAVETSTQFEVSHSTMEYNTAAQVGGAISAVQCSLILNNTLFIHNEAPTYGGAVSVLSTFSCAVESCDFEANSAYNGQGGALFLKSPEARLWNTTFVQNVAFDGGALLFVIPYDPNETDSVVMDCIFDSNVALSAAGAIYVSVEEDSGASPAPDPSAAAYSKRLCPSMSELPLQYLLSVTQSAYAIQRNLFVNNTALNGGAIFFEDFVGGDLQCSQCEFDSNVAHQFGGAVYTQEDSGLTLLVNSSFADNYARWGGSTIAFEEVPDPSTVLADTCVSCLFGDDTNSEGYGTTQGYATRTPPTPLTPLVTDALNAAPFSVELGLKDGFGTHVVGTILEDVNYVVSFTSSGEYCSVESPPPGLQAITEEGGGTTVSNITLEGKSNSTCTMRFSAGILEDGSVPYSGANVTGIDGPHSALADLSCQVSLGGCDNGQEVKEGESYDTCVDPSVWGGIVVMLLFLALLALICVLFVVIVLHQYRERQRLAEEAFYEELEIADDIMGMTSLEEILNDPDITRIPWHELEIIDRIGRGASGIVSSAYWRSEGELREVALKELTLELEEMDDKAAQDFLVEIRLMSALRHSRVVRFEGVSYHGGRLYLVTELMQYGSVKDVLLKKGRNLSWQVKTKLLHDAAMGMKYLHSKKLIHRDLKPQNLLVNNKWVCKVADFGVSTIKTTTRTMTAIGTPVYMAPEVLNNERYSETADVYSFGIVVAEVYTGRQPYSESGLNDAQLLYKIYHDALRPSTAGLPDLARRLVEEALTREAGLRPTFAEIVLRLKRLSKLEVVETGEDAEDGALELHLGTDESSHERSFWPEKDLTEDSPLLTTGSSVNADKR